MMEGLKVGIGLTGSYCNYSLVFPVIQEMKDKGAEIIPIMSYNAYSIDTRFGKASDWIAKLKEISGKKVLNSIDEVEPIGPKALCDVLVIAPCTGNTMAKLANAITDTPILMAIKSQLRNQRPVILAISSNDLLGLNCKNLGVLMNCPNLYFVPFTQDDPVNKINSISADFTLIERTIESAMKGKQLQPLILK